MAGKIELTPLMDFTTTFLAVGFGALGVSVLFFAERFARTNVHVAVAGFFSALLMGAQWAIYLFSYLFWKDFSPGDGPPPDTGLSSQDKKEIFWLAGSAAFFVFSFLILFCKALRNVARRKAG